MHAIFSAVGRFSVRFRWAVLIVWLVGAAAIIGAFPSLASVVQNNNDAFLPAGTPSTIAAHVGDVFEPAGLLPVPIVIVADHQLNSADEAYVTRVQKAMSNVSGVNIVRDLGASGDGEAQQLQVLTSVAGGPGSQASDLIKSLRAAGRTQNPPAGVEIHVTGDIAAQVDQQATSGNTGNKVQGLSIVLILIILLLIFRAVLAPLVTLIPAVAVSQVAGPIVAELANHGLKVSTLAQLMLIVLVLGAGTDYGLFLVFRVRENLRAGQEKHEAVIHAVERVGESIAASALTVVAALLSLFAASFGVYHDLGVPLAIGIILMLLAALTLLPALLALMGRAVFWPSKITPDVEGSPDHTGWWGALAGRVIARPVVTLVAGVVVFGALALATLGYASAGFGGSVAGPAGSDSAIGQTALTKHFPMTSANPTSILFRFKASVWTDPSGLAPAMRSLSSNNVFKGVTGPLNPDGSTISGAELTALYSKYGPPQRSSPATPKGVSAGTWRSYRSEAQFISAAGTTVDYNASLTAGDPSTTAALDAVPAMRVVATAAGKAADATYAGVAGQAPGLYDVSATSANDLHTVVPIAIIVIGILLAFVMRSLVAPIYLIVSVGLSYLAALGFCVILFQDILGDGGLTFILPFLMFLFLLALGEDYNILIMTRIREETHRRPLREAVVVAIRATGTTITSAGLVLAATFAVFAIAGGSGSGGAQVRDIGAGLALGILMDTFLVRTLLVPSVVVLLGRWNWWPGSLFHLKAPDHPELADTPI